MCIKKKRKSLLTFNLEFYQKKGPLIFSVILYQTYSTN